ncbi:MAG: phage major capsid protein [Candidatus Colwellbacteria bacterium]|nr:phage major capsid protein [Candidatus Colwellbacteria bacterium]
MPGITIEQAIDLGHATIQAFEKDHLRYALKHQTYEVINQWFKEDKMQLDGGDRVTRYISLRDTGNAQHVRMYDTDTPNISNVDEVIQVEWTHAQVSYTYSLKEIAMNQGNRCRIYNLLKQRHVNAYREFADLLEEAAWQTPDSASDDLKPFGIPGWIVQPDSDPAEGDGDFTGYVGNYWSDSEVEMATVGGVACSASQNPRWANYYEDHGGKLDSSLLKRLRRSFRKTKFQSPMFAKQTIDPESGFSRFRLYTNSDVLDELEEIALKSDDRVGADLGKYAGNVIFKGIPFLYVDVLDDAKQYVYGANPIFGVNHNHFYPVVLSNENFRENKPMNKVGQHNVMTVYIDLSYAYLCDNRRVGGFLISNWESTS